MKRHQASVADRRHVAHAALSDLGKRRSEWLRLEVLCSRTHRVAAVYDTPAGLVYASMIGARTHGSRDFVGTEQRHGGRGTEYVDLLRADPLTDDTLPAWCGCGPHTLSRSELTEGVRDHRKHLHVS